MLYEWIVYETTNIINNHIYIGVHKTKIGIFDGYIGNDIYCDKDAVKHYVFHKAVRKYGYKNFKRKTLFTFPDTIEGKAKAFRKEAELVNRDFLKRNDVYNSCLGGRFPSGVNEKPVAQYDLDGNFIADYISIVQATSITHEPKSTIQHSCSKLTYCNNYQWRHFTGDTSNIGKAQTIYKTVYQFDLKGNYITYYKSVTEAGNKNNIQDSLISAACLGKYHEIGGYYWSYKKQFNYVASANKKQKVACYTSDGKLFKVFNSLREADKEMHVNRSVIVNCIKGKSKFAKKLRWRYFDGDTSDIKPI